MTAENMAAVGAFLVSIGFFRWLQCYLKQWFADRKYINGFGRVGEVGKIMGQMTELGADRVMLFAGKNGGGIPSVGKPYSVSLIQAAGHGVDHSIATDYIDLPVDMHYVGLLEDIGRRGYVELHSDDLPACQIARYYSAENVTHSLWVFIGLKDMSFLFLSISKHFEVPFTANEKTRLLLKAQTIKRELG